MDKRRSFFFPFLLIGAGVVWLMISLGSLPASNLWALAHVWPFLLIAAGVGIIVRSYWPMGGALVSFLTLVGVLAAIFYAPQLGWDSGSFFNVSVDFLGGGERGSGVMTEEMRTVSEFDAVRLDYPAEVFIDQGDEVAVSIEAEDNLMPQLRTEVRGGTLTIDNGERDWGDRVDPTETVQIHITVTDLREVQFPTAGQLTISGLETEKLEITLSGAGDITLTDLNVEALVVALTGAGNLTADGVAGTLDVDIDGFGSLHAEDLAAQAAKVSINGAGNADVRVDETLSAVINGAGSISYIGSPQVTEQINGLGSISQRDD